MESKRTVDVRGLSPDERHPLIFRTFEELTPGTSFILVNDHDPHKLKEQFEAEKEDRFTWEYLEEGPQIWRVEIGKPDVG